MYLCTPICGKHMFNRWFKSLNETQRAIYISETRLHSDFRASFNSVDFGTSLNCQTLKPLAKLIFLD